MTQRIIKFRAWEIRTKLMWLNVEDAYDTLGEHGNEGEVLTPNCFGSLLDRPGEYVVMQFTGLLDKNGKEIYEGDIVAWQKRNYQFNDVVIFEKGRYWLPNFYMSSFDEVSDAFGEGLGMLEVIGNRYENPTLISHPLT